MTAKERNEWLRLHRLWALGKATAAQTRRCRALDRKARKTPAAQQARADFDMSINGV